MAYPKVPKFKTLLMLYKNKVRLCLTDTGHYGLYWYESDFNSYPEKNNVYFQSDDIDKDVIDVVVQLKMGAKNIQINNIIDVRAIRDNFTNAKKFFLIVQSGNDMKFTVRATRIYKSAKKYSIYRDTEIFNIPRHC